MEKRPRRGKTLDFFNQLLSYKLEVTYESSSSGITQEDFSYYCYYCLYFQLTPTDLERK